MVIKLISKKMEQKIEKLISDVESVKADVNEAGAQITRINTRLNRVALRDLVKFRDEIRRVSSTTVSDILSRKINVETVRLGGIFTNIQQRESRRGTIYGELLFEDLTGHIKVFAFKDRWAAIRNSVELDIPYILDGRVPLGSEYNTNVYLESLQSMEIVKRKSWREL